MSERDPQSTEPVMGVQLDHVYDGVSVWQLADGSLVNRWDRQLAEAIFNGRDADVPVLRRRRDLTQLWIDTVGDEAEHFVIPVDGHGNGPVDDAHWDHDACSCGNPSWRECDEARRDARGQVTR